MQPKQTMKKTLLASALILGLGNAFHASSDVFPVSAGAVSDVDITQHPSLGDAEVNFGNRIKLNPTANSKCIIVGVTNAFEDEIGVNIDVSTDNAENADRVNSSATLLNDNAGPAVAHDVGDIAYSSDGCLGDAASGASSGSYMVLEVTGTPATTVSVDIPNVSDTGWTYAAGEHSCVVDFNNAVTAETCQTFAGRTSVTGVGLSGATEGGSSTAVTEDNEGQTHIFLAGELTFDGTPLTAGAVTETITVTVTYE